MYIRSLDGNYLVAKCPKCLTDGAYHISVSPNESGLINLLAICKECSYCKLLPKPQLNKRVIYLDQFCTSNVGKVRVQQKSNDERYEELNRELLLLIKHQLAVFPSSHFHTQETSYISNLEKRKLIQHAIELFACGTRLNDPDTIIEMALLNELFNKGSLQIDEILHGKRNSWEWPQFRISLSIEHVSGKFREEWTKQLNDYLKDKKQSQENILNELADEYVKKVIRNDIKNLFEKEGSSLSSALKNIPILRIIATLLAELSVDFSGGRKKSIGNGMAVDILFVAHILPYVDAIFVDKGMHALLGKSKAIPEEYKKKVYSLQGNSNKNNLKDFITFLRSIENSVPQYCYAPFIFTHRQLINAYYEKPSELSPLSLLKLGFLEKCN